MLNKAAEFYEDEVDNSVSRLSHLMEPIITVVLGSLIGILLIAMYLPLFNLGNVVGLICLIVFTLPSTPSPFLRHSRFL